MRFDLITLFPEMFDILSQGGIVKRALTKHLIQIHTHNPRDFTQDPHHTVDDRPYGGGPGMVMMVPPLRQAIHSARSQTDSENQLTVYLSPQGQRLTQEKLHSWTTLEQVVLICGRYEGIDERVLEHDIDEEVSIGDYVLTGGELPAMIIIDALTRLLPGSLGHAESAGQDSFCKGRLDHPHYTRPEVFEGQSVPSVLLSGNHQAIKAWRRKAALQNTLRKRPDLIDRVPLTAEERDLLEEK
ncbi:MAG: tRNA (guanosine(37)-N1)-methyltransferase TrmD [Gammaproteobacteria bacterium]|nr:MAG: tRNA (guanosine(37)-N1)-methyltransferase TrmD [Gammaproteobacteria bacterium]